MSTLFFNFFKKIFYRKFVHSIHTYINMSPLYKCPENKTSPALYADKHGK